MVAVKTYMRMIGCMLFLYSAAFLGAILLFKGHTQFRKLLEMGNPSGFEETLNEMLPVRDNMISPWQKCLSMTRRRYFADSNMFVNDEGQIIKGSDSTISLEFAFQKVKELKTYCDSTGRNFLYVFLPGKPYSDEELLKWGIQCKRNAGTNLMSEYLQQNGISSFDARTLFSEEDFYQYFFKTDHHWTPDAGLKTARALLEQLNLRFGYSFEADILDDSQFTRKVVPDKWIGEFGEKALGRYAEKDDFISLKPSFPVTLRYRNIIRDSEWLEGDFDILLDKEIFNKVKFEGQSMYYYYLPDAGSVEIENPDVDEGTILIIKDSFSNVMLPYLSLGISHLTAWDMRDDKAVYDYLKAHPEIETVMIVYNISFVSTERMNDFQ